MHNRALPIVVSLLCALSVVGQGPSWAALPKVVVTHCANNHRDPALSSLSGLAGELETALAKTGRFEVLDAVALGLNTEGAVDFARLQALGIDYVVRGSLGGEAAYSWATATFTGVAAPQTGSIAHVVKASCPTVPYAWGFLCWQLAQSAREALTLQGEVLAAPGGGQVVISLGRQHGLTTRDRIVVLEILDEVRDPNTGRALSTSTREVAHAQPTDIQDQTTRCQLDDPGAAVKVGMRVRTTPADEVVAARAEMRIAVTSAVTIPPADPQNDGEWFTGLLTTTLADGRLPGDCTLLEREAFDKIEEENELVARPDFDWDTVPLGRSAKLAATVLLVPTLTRRDGQYGVSVRVIDQASVREMTSDVRAGPELDGALASQVATDVVNMLRITRTERVRQRDVPLEAGVRLGYEMVAARQYSSLPRLVGDLMTWRLKNTGDHDLRLRLVTKVPGYGLAPLATETTLRPGQTLQLGQTPPLDEARLAALAEPERVQVDYRLVLVDGEKELLGDSKPLRLLPPTTWLSRVPIPESEGTMLSLEPTLLAWARQSDLLIQVRGKAAAKCGFGELPGYQSERIRAAGLAVDTPEQRRAAVREQVRGVYEALRERKVLYVDQPGIAFPALEGQQVLTPDQVLTSGGANCLDGSLLFAAVLMPVLRPIIVITEGHALVGWQSWSNADAPWDLLETTHLMTADFDTALAEGQEQARQVGIAELLEGKLGTLEFNARGELDSPALASFHLVRALLDANKSKGFLQGQEGI